MKINRIYYSVLEAQFDEPKISILVGPRQVGKTFLMKELDAAARRRGLKTRFFDLEQPGDMLALGATDKEQFDVLVSAGDVVFVDEMHLLGNISHVLKAVHDSRHKVKIFASGSSALAMHKHLKESMAGRTITSRIHPLCLEELQQISGYKDAQALTYGGMPGLVNCPDEERKIIELEQIVSTYIAKDIKGLIKEENVRAFNQLIYLIAERQGSVVTTTGFASDIGMSKPSVEKYLETLSKTYVCHPLNSYAKNLRNELKKSRKYYLFDIGIRNSMLKDFRGVDDRDDAGVLRESIVMQNIMRQLKPNMEVRFWRTKRGDEIDFILIKNRVPYPVEVKSRLARPEVPRGVRIFLDNYPQAPGATIYNDSLEVEVEYAGRSVEFRRWQASDNISYLQDVV